MKLKVIFVDDEEKVLKGIRRSLRSMKNTWDMDFSLGGADALEKFSKEPYHVIVSDMMMPEMSGEELLSVIKEKYPDTARIVLSGQCNQATAFRLVGSDHFFLSKPCPTDLLIETIENAALHSSFSTGQEVDAEEVKEALCDFVKLLLMRGVIKINVVPASIKKWLPETTLNAFAPVVGEYNEFVKKTDFSQGDEWSEEKPQNLSDSWQDYFEKPD